MLLAKIDLVRTLTDPGLETTSPVATVPVADFSPMDRKSVTWNWKFITVVLRALWIR